MNYGAKDFLKDVFARRRNELAAIVPLNRPVLGIPPLDLDRPLDIPAAVHFSRLVAKEAAHGP